MDPRSRSLFQPFLEKMGDSRDNENDLNIDIEKKIPEDTGVEEEYEEEVTHFRSTPCRLGCSEWCSKYFWEGQSLSNQQQQALVNISDEVPFHLQLLVKYRRLLGLFIPAAFCHFIWWSIAIRNDLWHLFLDKYYMSLTMIFGSIVAGMTSEGGGAVAYPVMTLAFDITPPVARDFSLMIQACGMSAASFAIFFMKLRLEWNSLAYGSIGGMCGVIFGLYCVDPNLKPSHKKMAFVCIWFSFAFALFLLNRYSKRRTFKRIPEMKFWKCLVLVIAGFIGGTFSSFAGSGLDICMFSVITLLFRVTEKIATPTSVVLMAANSLFATYWRHVMMEDVSTEAWEYLFVCAPVVVIGAPLGSVLGSHFHRQVLAALVYILDTVALITAFVIVKQTPVLTCVSIGIVFLGFGFFFTLTRLGNKIMIDIPEEKETPKETQYTDENDVPNSYNPQFE